VLILDEPTNHLDIAARDALVSALNEFNGAVILISHDQQLLAGCVDEFFLVDQGAVTRFDGDLDDYKKWLLDKPKGKTKPNNNQENTEFTMTQKVNRKEQRQAAAELRKATQKMRKKAASLEVELSELVEKRQMIITELGDQKTYTVKKDELESLFVQKDVLDKKIQRCEQDWLELEEEIEKSSLSLGIN